ncbi:MAG TPA: DUF3617 domain-containing protein [Rhodocyclaceae bacterium]|nr:DUF3617 domain-containing protein [Rhodocyclaceae bacterium]
MKRSILAVALAMSAAGTLAETMVKSGLWEVRVVRQIMDGRDVTALMPVALAGMQQMIASMTPEQRKQVEVTLGKKAAIVSTAQRICISPEMAAGDKPLLPPDVRCEPTAFNRGGSRVTFEFRCADQGRTVTGKGESLLASEDVATRIDLVMNDASGRHTMQNESQAKFVGADCGSLKPADQVAREMQAARKK